MVKGFRIKPLIGYRTQGLRTEPLGALGISYGYADEERERGRIAVWVFRHRYLHSRTQDNTGQIHEHYRLKGISFELECGARIVCLAFERTGGHWRPTARTYIPGKLT